MSKQINFIDLLSNTLQIGRTSQFIEILGVTKVLQNRTGQPKTEPNRHRRWQKKVKSNASVQFQFSLPVSPEAFGFTCEIEFNAGK